MNVKNKYKQNLIKIAMKGKTEKIKRKCNGNLY